VCIPVGLFEANFFKIGSSHIYAQHIPALKMNRHKITFSGLVSRFFFFFLIYSDIYTRLGASPAAYVPTLIRNENDSKMWANAVGSVFEKGYSVEWKALYPNPIPIKLPNYPFDYKVSF
jgi:hypothetical protein